MPMEKMSVTAVFMDKGPRAMAVVVLFQYRNGPVGGCMCLVWYGRCLRSYPC